MRTARSSVRPRRVLAALVIGCSVAHCKLLSHHSEVHMQAPETINTELSITKDKKQYAFEKRQEVDRQKYADFLKEEEEEEAFLEKGRVRVYNPDGTPYHSEKEIKEQAEEKEEEQSYNYLMGILSLWIVALITYGLWRFYQKYLDSNNVESRSLLNTRIRNVESETQMRESKE